MSTLGRHNIGEEVGYYGLTHNIMSTLGRHNIGEGVGYYGLTQQFFSNIKLIFKHLCVQL